MPFFMLGDPDLVTCERLLDAAIAAGADALELGMPFSDPIADGPVIQAAAVRAHAAGATTTRCLDLVTKIRQKHPAIPIGLLVYANLVVARGVESFYARARAAGVDSVLVADVPLGESAPFVVAAQQAAVAPIFILPPDAADAVVAAVARASSGYVYVLGRSGVTGDGVEPVFPGPSVFAALRAHGAPPALVGFGISRPEHVRAAIANGAAGAISGSAIVGRIAKATDPLHEVSTFVRAMVEAARG